MQTVDKESQRLPEVAVSAAVGVLVYLVVEQLVRGVVEATTVSLRDSFLWITSPSRKTTVKLPFYTALRIVRKQGWRLAEVEPIRHVGRWEGLRIFLFGDSRKGIPR